VHEHNFIKLNQLLPEKDKDIEPPALKLDEFEIRRRAFFGIEDPSPCRPSGNRD
jgi:hypothetical protein